MPRPQRQRHSGSSEIIEHEDEDSYNQDPEEFLDRIHPENDEYMRGVEHVQRKILHVSKMLRPKQVNMIKAVFAGKSYKDAAAQTSSHYATVSRVVNSPEGQRLLSLLQYHLKLLEGPNEALRRNMIWRIAVKNEVDNPKIALQALTELNKMHFQQVQIESPELAQAKQQVVININQNTLPKGGLDR